MTELTTYQPPTIEHATFSDPTGGRLVAWAEGLAAAHRIGAALCQTSFVPQQFRGKPEEAAAAILYGDEIGFTPTQSLQNIYVISGKPSMYARSMVALLMSHGHEVWTVEKTDAKVTVAGRRKGSSHTIEETWTTARASKAGYTNNKKYQTDPQAMLYARAASDVCRQVAPDSLAGIAYTVEEMELDAPAPTVRVSRAKPQPAPIPEPDLEHIEATPVTPEPDIEPPVEEPADLITQAQSKALHASFNDAGVTDRDARLDYCRNLIGREITTSSELTKAEASRVIDALKQDASDE
jgi:hypothetical protein